MFKDRIVLTGLPANFKQVKKLLYTVAGTFELLSLNNTTIVHIVS